MFYSNDLRDNESFFNIQSLTIEFVCHPGGNWGLCPAVGWALFPSAHTHTVCVIFRALESFSLWFCLLTIDWAKKRNRQGNRRVKIGNNWSELYPAYAPVLCHFSYQLYFSIALCLSLSLCLSSFGNNSWTPFIIRIINTELITKPKKTRVDNSKPQIQLL